MSFIKGTWNDKATLSIPCPHCGKKTEELVAKLQNERTFTCPGCGIISKVPDDVLASLDALKKAILKFK